MKARVVISMGVLLAFGLLTALNCAGEPRYNKRTLSSWLKQCEETPLDQDKQLKEAQAAVRAIGATKALPTLFDLITTKDTRVREWLVEQSERFDSGLLQWPSATEFQLEGIAGFEALGTNAAPAVGRLDRMLDDKELAFVAVRCLEYIGKPAESALCRGLTNQDWRVRSLSVSALASATDGVEVYLARIKDRLKDREPAVRFATVQAVGAQEHAPDLAVPLLIPALEDADDGVGQQAAGVLAGFGTNAATAFTALTNMVDVGRPGQITAALKTLPAVAPAEAQTVLSNVVVNGSPDMLGVALKGLKIIRPELALEMTLAQFRSPDARRRARVVRLAVDYTVATTAIVEALKFAAADGDPDVAKRATVVMREMVQKQKEATKGKVMLPGEPVYQGRPLGEWLAERDRDGQFSSGAKAALQALGTNAIPALLARLAYREPVFGLPDFDVSVGATSALITLGEHARPALPALTALMDGDDQQPALLAMMATLGTGADAAPCLMKGLTNRFADVRNEAAGAMTGDWGKQFPELRKQAMPLLVKLLDDPDQSVRMNVTNGLKYLDQEPPSRIHQH